MVNLPGYTNIELYKGSTLIDYADKGVSGSGTHALYMYLGTSGIFTVKAYVDTAAGKSNVLTKKVSV